mmetsp:Transcript_48108/g.113097  ORF Transcript_48108/g.113097 Transcript_48108/m.113097 type:complete len:141 (+) Transcript_48108:29-451(+)
MAEMKSAHSQDPDAYEQWKKAHEAAGTTAPPTSAQQERMVGGGMAFSRGEAGGGTPMKRSMSGRQLTDLTALGPLAEHQEQGGAGAHALLAARAVAKKQGSFVAGSGGMGGAVSVVAEPTMQADIQGRPDGAPLSLDKDN